MVDSKIRVDNLLNSYCVLIYMWVRACTVVVSTILFLNIEWDIDSNTVLQLDLRMDSATSKRETWLLVHGFLGFCCNGFFYFL